MPDIKQFEPLWGTWRTEDQIGEGSFGKVYRGVREEYGKKYYSAIKHISIPASESQINDAIEEGIASDDASASEYFNDIARSLVDEISLMNEVKGITNIVSYEDHLVVPKSSGVGCDIFIRMELLTALNSVLRTKQLPEDDVIQLGIDICSALEVCAQKGIIHRDIKPANIFINDSGAYKLGDFGVARHLEGTTAGMSKKGTYNYMAPEVYRGEPANATADIYSLGMVMYRLLNGNRAPFLPADNSRISAGQNEAALARRMSGEPLPAPAYASPAMANVIQYATQFDRKKRFQSAKALKNALISLRKASANQQSTAGRTTCEPVQYGSPTPFRSTNNYSGNSTVYAADNSTVYASEEVRAVADTPKPQNQTFAAIKHTFAAIKEKADELLRPLKEKYLALPKKKRKTVKALSIIASVILLLAVYYFTSPYIYKIENGEVTIDKYIGISGNVKVPKSYFFMPVTSIDNGAFDGCHRLKSITIPDSVTYIGDFSFYDCDSLESVTISDSVTDIDIGAFGRCTSLESITIPDSVTSIGTRAFSGCTSLESITIPDSVTSIGDDAFYGCTSLESIKVHNKNPYYCDIDGVLFNRSKTEIISYPRGRKATSYVIPDSVTSIGDYAFYGCTSLESITIPDSVTSIDNWAFDGCTSLESITIPDSVTSIGTWAFSGCTSLENIKVDNGNPNFCDIDGVLFNRDKTKIITYPAGRKATSYVIPDSVTSIGDYAFDGCTSLESIIIPDSVTSIGDDAFDGCTSLEGITIPDSVTSIGWDAFYGCTGLESITIPDSVTSIGYYAFEGCTSLESITIPDSVTYIGDYAFEDCASLEGITIPDSVTSIGDYAFRGCTSLKSITIPDSVTSIDLYAFEGCTITVYAPHEESYYGGYPLGDNVTWVVQ